MKILDVNLTNLIPGKGYLFSVIEGGGTINMKGWNGVATLTHHDVLLTGTELQKLKIEMKQMFEGDEFTGTPPLVLNYDNNRFEANGVLSSWIGSYPSEASIISKYYFPGDFDIFFDLASFTSNNSSNRAGLGVAMINAPGYDHARMYFETLVGGNGQKQLLSDYGAVSGNVAFTTNPGSVRFVRVGTTITAYSNGQYFGTVSGLPLGNLRWKINLGGGTMPGQANVAYNRMVINSGAVVGWKEA